MGHSPASGALHTARAAEAYHQVSHVYYKRSKKKKKDDSRVLRYKCFIHFGYYFRILWMVPIYSLDSVSKRKKVVFMGHALFLTVHFLQQSLKKWPETVLGA